MTAEAEALVDELNRRLAALEAGIFEALDRVYDGMREMARRNSAG